MKYLYKLLLLFLISTSAVFSQTYNISGKVISAKTGEALIGANVYIKALNVGAATDADGTFLFAVKKGEYKLTCSYIGYETNEMLVNVTNNTELNFELKEYQFSLSVDVIADRARELETPVAFSNVDKAQMELQLGSQDVPMALNTTPSVYATMQGGGAGDARINVRGFNQRNVAIMINGVPVNDMENGWVYWSNWDGIGDATSSMQVQRGLSAINLATPSIGGTMNIITDPAALKFGAYFKQEFGNASFLKSTLSLNTGLIDKKWAVSLSAVRKVGDGFIDKTWTDAYAYYLGAAYNIDDKNRIELYAVGAPQRHGQNLYRQNIGAYSKEFALGLRDYDPAAANRYTEKGRFYNENWNNVSHTYKGKQYWNGSTHDRYDSGFLNERENYFHKPVINFNYYTQISDNFSLYNTAYWSGGKGGGTGTFGSLRWDYSGPSRVADWNATIQRNRTNADGSRGILRNSVNNQWTIGAISKAYIKLNESIDVSIGIDWRTAEIDHFREVRDLLGGDYYVFKGNQFDNDVTVNQRKGLGDKIDYSNTNTVDWLGFYGQTEYSEGAVTAYATYGWSTIKYSYKNHFLAADTLANGNPDLGSGELKVNSDNIIGYQLKGGASYRVSKNVSLFTNLGYVSKAPIFDNVIDDRSGTVADDPENEKFTSFEGGVSFKTNDGQFAATVNYYYTKWEDRANSRGILNPDGSEGLVFLKGMNTLHKGLEIEGAFQPVPEFRLDGAISFGNWTHTDNVNGTYKSYDTENQVLVTQDFDYYVKDLKVGDAPQTQIALSASIRPTRGAVASLVMRSYRDFYADWDPFSRFDANDNAQSWKAPAYTIFDLHFSYLLPFDINGFDLRLFGHVFNLFDEIYIQDAVDNSRFNAYSSNGKNHSADDAEVYLGLPRSFNIGISIAY